MPAGSVTSWSDEVDVLVVGAGMAGTCAAVEAARGGARVLLLDRGGPGTSTSAMSGGDFYLGGGTAVQRATGHEDSAEEMEKYLLASSPDADPAKIRLYCQDSVEHFDWLEGLGFEFERSYYAAKAVVQPGTEGLMYTGSEKAHPFCELARPAPRGHKPPFVGDVGGGGFVVERALEECARLGVEVRYDTGVTALVVEDGSAVVGATWKRYAETGAVRAGAVVVAAGGFVMNEDMIAAYAPRLQALVARGMALGNSFDDGLGIRLGESVGGVAEHMEGAFFTSPFYPPGDTLKGIVVNKAGERFVNEDGYHSRTASALFEQPGAEGYLILDSATMVEPSYGFQPLVDGWETVEEMEAGLGMPEGALVATLRDYDKHAAEGHDPALPQGRRVAGAARPGAVGCLRPHPRQGVLRRLHDGRAARLGGRRGAARGRLAGPRGLRRRRVLRPTSPSTAPATPAAPSSARRRTSAAGRVATPPRLSRAGPGAGVLRGVAGRRVRPRRAS